MLFGRAKTNFDAYYHGCKGLRDPLVELYKSKFQLGNISAMERLPVLRNRKDQPRTFPAHGYSYKTLFYSIPMQAMAYCKEHFHILTMCHNWKIFTEGTKHIQGLIFAHKFLIHFLCFHLFDELGSAVALAKPKMEMNLSAGTFQWRSALRNSFLVWIILLLTLW